MDDKKEESSQEVPQSETDKYTENYMPENLNPVSEEHFVEYNFVEGEFSYGLGLSVIAWLVSSLIISMFMGSIGMVGIICLISLIIWIPLALIAGRISRVKGKKPAGTFVMASFFIAFVIVGGCFGILR